MAFSFGGGVNPQLGAIDYSPILRGAQNYAQSTAAGSAAIGQGIGSALASLGGAVQQYYDKKEKKQLEDDAFNTASPIIRNNPELQRILKIQDPKDDKMLRSVIKTFGAGNILNLAKSVEDAQKESKAIESAMAAGMSPLERGLRQPGATFEGTMGLSSAPVPKGVAEIIRDYAAAGGRNFAGITAAARAINPNQKAQKPFTLMTMEQIDELRKRGQDVKWMPVPGRNDIVAVTEGGTFAPPSQTNINLGEDKMRVARYENLMKTRNDVINPIIANKPYIDAMEGLLGAVDKDGKIITGKLANLELATKSLLNATGLSNFEDVQATQAYLGSAVGLVGQIIKQFGAGTALSDADRRFAEQAAAGQIAMDSGALRRLIGLAKKVQDNKISAYQSELKSSFGGNSKEDEWAYNSLALAGDWNKSGAASMSMPTNAPEIRYDRAGNAWTKDANGNVIPYNR